MSAQDFTDGIGGLFIVAACGIVYFIPTIVAHTRKKANFGSIVALNVLTGWTFIGWVIALVWALAVDRPTTEAQ